ncbi:MAG: DUF1127 domain-containing protein [Acidihalobacter sp.]|uniref:DUF1127 domain-containing protein n=1 Tax=Acidihalobacter sp. TaxID=1872108 RepID=UPI00307FA80C
MSDFYHTHCEIPRPQSPATIQPLRATHTMRLPAALSGWLHAWQRRREFKRLARRLLSYDDHQLDDMGYTREDLLAAIDQPLKLDSHSLLTGWRERRLKAQAAPAKATRRRPGQNAVQTSALLSGISLGIVGPTTAAARHSSTCRR